MQECGVQDVTMAPGQSGQFDVTSDGATTRIAPGTAAYLYRGAQVGIRQVGETDLTVIIAYPLPKN